MTRHLEMTKSVMKTFKKGTRKGNYVFQSKIDLQICRLFSLATLATIMFSPQMFQHRSWPGWFWDDGAPAWSLSTTAGRCGAGVLAKRPGADAGEVATSRTGYLAVSGRWKLISAHRNVGFHTVVFDACTMH